MRVVVAAAALVVAAAGQNATARQNATAGQNATVWDTTVWDTRLGTMVSPECEPILAKAGLAWLTKPFKCSAGNHSTKPIVVGTGLGDTGTHSVAAAVEALGFQSCHRWKINLELLRLSRPDDLRPFASADAYFDSPMAALLPRLACAFPNLRAVHTTRAVYVRDYTHARRPERIAQLAAQGDQHATKCDLARPYLQQNFIARCIEYGSPCPTQAVASAAFEASHARLAFLPAAQVLVMNLSAPHGFDRGRLATFLRGNASALGNPDEFIPRATKRNGGAGQADTDCYWSSTYLEVKPPGGYHHHHKQRKFKYGLSSNTS
mmetsp:Transcript_14473/g.44687  ORF Transcript_14473/g.44687 Transcript_14473/m.44687 type:complete len:320 (+) Transcript_14473:119-1078(+)